MHDASLLSVDELSCIDSNTDTDSEESVSDKRETADADLSDSEETRIFPDLPPVWWDSMMSDMKRDISSMLLTNRYIVTVLKYVVPVGKCKLQTICVSLLWGIQPR